MTVYTDKIKNDYIGDGVATAFPFEFVVYRSDELIVTLDGVETSDYSAAGFANDSGGVVSFNTPPAIDVAVRLERVMPYHQIVDYQDYDPFPAQSHEMGLDRIVMLLQQVAARLGVVVTTSGEEGIIFPPYMAGEYIRWSDTEVQLASGIPVAQTVDEATDGEAVDDGNSVYYVFTPAQLKLAVEAHQTKHVYAASLPGTPDPDTFYYIGQ